MPKSEDIPACPIFEKVELFGVVYTITPGFRRERVIRETVDRLCEGRGLGLFPDTEAARVVEIALGPYLEALLPCPVDDEVETEDGDDSYYRWGRHLRPYPGSDLGAWVEACIEDYPEDEADLRAYADWLRRKWALEDALRRALDAAAEVGALARREVTREVETEFDLQAGG